MRVDQETITAAYFNFIEVFYPENKGTSQDPGLGHNLWAFLGMKKLPLQYGDPWHMPEDIAHRLRLLAGPYYATVAKIMEMNGHQHKVPLE